MLEIKLEDRIIATLDKNKTYVIEVETGDAGPDEVKDFCARICKAFKKQDISVFVVPKKYKVNIKEIEKIKSLEDKFNKNPKEIDC